MHVIGRLLILPALGFSMNPARAESIEDRLLRDRVGTYSELTLRLRNDGPNASFPEFAPVVSHLSEAIKADWVSEVVDQHPDLGFERDEALNMLFHVNIQFSYADRTSYPYLTPFEGVLPYRPTWDAIERAIAFLDKVDRTRRPDQATPLYHFDRYAYHRHRMMSDPRVVLIPTLASLGFNELIEVRGVPIGLVGIVTEGLRVDRHYQTPLDFLYHDFNHVRRMVEYLFGELRKHGALTFDQEIAVYQRMDDFVHQTLMPHIAKVKIRDDRAEFSRRALLRVLIFEILHETALPATREAILNDLLRRPGIKQPFEVMMEQVPPADFDLETLRTKTGNLSSGAKAFRAHEGDPMKIHFMQDRALALLANVYNKISRGFFDDPDLPQNYVAPVEARTPEGLLGAAKRLFEILEFDGAPDDDVLLGWITSRVGGPEKFTSYRGLKSEADPGSNLETGRPLAAVTELLDADGAIAAARTIKAEKSIVTFMGFSANGYEDPDVVDDLILEKLKTLDPARTLINSGATKGGISRVYALAKARGFETMGVVSTQALSYAGQFAADVDNIVLVDDANWGGHLPDGGLTPVTRVFVEISDEMFVIGGGQNTAVTLAAFAETGRPLSFRAAEMHHETGRREAFYNKEESPRSYAGAAHAAWRGIARQRVRAAAAACDGALTRGT